MRWSSLQIIIWRTVYKMVPVDLKSIHQATAVAAASTRSYLRLLPSQSVQRNRRSPDSIPPIDHFYVTESSTHLFSADYSRVNMRLFTLIPLLLIGVSALPYISSDDDGTDQDPQYVPLNRIASRPSYNPDEIRQRAREDIPRGRTNQNRPDPIQRQNRDRMNDKYREQENRQRLQDIYRRLGDNNGGD